MSEICNRCSAEIEDNEVQKCEHCGEDGLGNCCIGEADHPCAENQEEAKAAKKRKRWVHD